MVSKHATAKNGSIAIVIFVLGLMMPIETPAQDVRGINVVPDSEKRSSIHELDAYAHLSENMTLAQTRAAAFANAKRQALEMAKTHIKTKTKVEDFEVKYDLIWSEAEGAVSVIEQKDHGVEDNARYHVWIKAEVEYGLRSKAASDPSQNMDPGLPLKVKVWTSKKKYKKDDSIEISIQGNRDFYARVVDIAADGTIIQLLPNAYRKDSFFRAGVLYKIPDGNDRFDLKVTPPFGEDNIVVYASEVPLGEVTTEPIGRGLARYRGTQESLASTTRGISVVPTGKQGSSSAEFYEATWTVSTGE
ncbi:MAG: DUF4384 domain-containing protein [Desulfobacterales bacterium]